MGEKNISAKEKKKSMEEKIFFYYRQIVDERMKLEFALDSNKKRLEQVKQHIAYFKEAVDEIEIFTPKVNYSMEVEKKKSLVQEKQQLELLIEQQKENLHQLRKKETDYREIICWTKSISVVETEKEKYQLDESKIHMLEVQEMERQRIARELHDSATQNLVALVNKLDFCSSLTDIDSIRCRLEIQSVMKYLKDTITDIRETIYDLRPMAFDDIGMDVALEQFIDKVKSVSNLHIEVEDKDNILKNDKLKIIFKLSVFRIIQEACNNIVRHAQAKNINVCLKKVDNMLWLSIEDDGIGFEYDELESHGKEDNSGFGLSMMKERAYLLSGDFQIESAKGKGTKITVKIPFLEEDI